MKKHTLHETIEELRVELEKTEPANEHMRGHIQRLLLEIDMLRKEPGDIPAHRYQQFLERLRESAQHFEASHLSLTLAMGRVIDALSNMGV
jgi:uncharacterized coiled-coil DUF342 family protein